MDRDEGVGLLWGAEAGFPGFARDGIDAVLFWWDVGSMLKGGSTMRTRHAAEPASSPFARPDGTCLGRRPEEEAEGPVPVAPAEPEDPPVDPAEPINPA